MRQPKKWKDTINPFDLQFNSFKITKVLGYPHARNDVFYLTGEQNGKKINCFLKYSTKNDSDIKREVDAIKQLNFKFLPKIIESDESSYILTKKMPGERLSYILKNNKGERSTDYMYEYGKSLALIHQTNITAQSVKERSFFSVPNKEQLEKLKIDYIYSYLQNNKPTEICSCFCHGDFHYANVLWKNKKISAVLDWELSGIGNRDFDIAWAIFNRPGQEFLRTKREIELFFKGYLSIAPYNENNVYYYMAQIYAHFLSISKNGEYHKFVKSWLKRFIKNKKDN